MTDHALLGPWIRRFLLEHAVAERNLARHTQSSYRDTLSLLLPFVGAAHKMSVDRLAIESLSSVVIRRFLEYLEQDRGCLTATRNQRLAAIHSLARFIGQRSPEHVAWCIDVRNIPFKKTTKPVVAYLEKPEVDALLKVPDPRTVQGARDYTVLLFLYNTGARVEEAAGLTVADVQWTPSAVVRLLGKGRKTRSCPLWPQTAELLKRQVGGRAPPERVFLNRRGQPLTRFGIYALVRRAAEQASMGTPSLATKRIGPHSLRHTCAVYLLRSGVDINTIRAWLGHVSLDTTNVYAEVDLEMKANALARCDIPKSTKIKRWHQQPNLIAFLRELGRGTMH